MPRTGRGADGGKDQIPDQPPPTTPDLPPPLVATNLFEVGSFFCGGGGVGIPSSPVWWTRQADFAWGHRVSMVHHQICNFAKGSNPGDDEASNFEELRY